MDIVQLSELARLPIEVVLLVLVMDIRRTLRGHGERIAGLESREPLTRRQHSGDTTQISNRRTA